MAKVPQTMSTTWQTTQIPPISQPRDLDRTLRSDLSGSFPPLDTELNSPSRNIARAICLEFTKVVMRMCPRHRLIRSMLQRCHARLGGKFQTNRHGIVFPGRGRSLYGIS